MKVNDHHILLSGGLFTGIKYTFQPLLLYLLQFAYRAV